MKDMANPHAGLAPSEWIVKWSHLLAPGATLLDVACGQGRHMQWFAALINLPVKESAIARGVQPAAVPG